MAFTVCRIQKIKSWGELGGSEQHTTRNRETPNADPFVSNIRLIGTANDPDLATLVQEKIGDRKIRKNAVLAVEFILSASAEYFRPDNPSQAGAYDSKRLNDFADAATHWLQSQSGGRLVRSELHLDEATPHIHAYLVPLDEQGKLNCRALFGGSRKRLSELQDSFARSVQHLGIERGIKGSQATHTEVKDYYADIHRDSLSINLEQLPQPLRSESATDYRQRVQKTLQPLFEIINHQLSDRQRLLKQKEELKQTTLSSEKERQKLEQRLHEQDALTHNWKELANQLRDLPLEDVAYELGLDPDRKGKNRWKGQGHIIHITDSKFYDFSGKQQGGGGAIDLVMHIRQCEFKQAVAWLSDRFGSSGMLQAVTHHARVQAQLLSKEEPVPKFVPPLPDESKWLSVQHYLTHERQLPSDWVKALHQQKLVYADSKQNAVFVQRSLDGETTGAFLRGTVGKDNTFLGLATGSKRSVGWFYVRYGRSETDLIERVVLLKSPIDAISFLKLDYPPRTKTLYLTADSARSLPLDFLKKIPTLIAAYDNDSAGDEIARQIKQLLPQATRVRPKAKDWNEELKRQQQQEPKQQWQEQER